MENPGRVQKQKDRMTGNKNHFYGKKHTKETKKILSDKLKKLWKKPEFIKKVFKSINTLPNKPETIILNLLNDLFPNEWKYVGDYKLFIHGKNPDFVNESDTKLIEHFGLFYHGEEQTGIPNHVHESERIKHFREYGDYDTLIIWEDELYNVEQLINKLINFNKRNLVQLSGGTNH